MVAGSKLDTQVRSELRPRSTIVRKPFATSPHLRILQDGGGSSAATLRPANHKGLEREVDCGRERDVRRPWDQAQKP
jgi:hypothetical protein